jgi:hypothetical protein
MTNQNSYTDAFNSSIFSFDNATLKFSAYQNPTLGQTPHPKPQNPSPQPQNPQNEILEKKR